MDEQSRDSLTVDDVRHILGRARALKLGEDPATARPLERTTVWDYVNKSRNGRYADKPMPLPQPLGGVPGQNLVWYPKGREGLAGLERRLMAWYAARPGQGAGGGRKVETTTNAAGKTGGKAKGKSSDE